MPALSDLRVLDLSGNVAGPFCGRMFAGFGADVVKVEPPGGEEGRRLPPLIDGAEGPEASAFFLWLNAGKRGIVLDLEQPEGIAALRRLVQDADMVLESFAPGTMTGWGLGYADLERIKPGIILTSVTPFGQSGPWRDVPSNDLVAGALSGWASVNGRPGREPLKPAGYQASFQAGIAAYVATMGALSHRDRHGEGQHVDISLLDPSVASFAPDILAAQYRGVVPGPRPGGFSSGPVPARDGHFSLTISRAHFWRDAMVELGLPELGHDERYYESSYRQAHQHEVAALVEERIAARDKRELFERLSTLRVVGGMVLTTEELFDDPQVQARNFLSPLTHPSAGELLYPDAPFKMARTPWHIERPAPRLGEHSDEVLSAVGVKPHPPLASLAAPLSDT